MNGVNGILPIFKESGFTSHDVVAKLRGILKMKKIGHTGTLDPNAVGVLPITLGKATKISDYLMGLEKEYIAEIYFGIETDTEDIWGNITNTSDRVPDSLSIKRVLNQYQDTFITQIPPMYSAKKINGKKLYEYARSGDSIKRKPINVQIITSQWMLSYGNRALIRIRCSKGTYIRTFIKNLSRELGTVGTMSYLIRTESSGFRINESYKLSQIEDKKELIQNLIHPIDKSLSFMPRVDLEESYFKKITNGVKIPTERPIGEKNLIFCRNEFIGIGEVLDKKGTNYLKVKKMMYLRNEDANC